MSDTSRLYSLLDKQIQKQNVQSYKKGDLIEATVERILDKHVIVEINGVINAIIPSSELHKGTSELKVGDIIKVFVVKPEDEYGNMVVSQTRTTVGQRWDMLDTALKNNESLSVTVLEANNGGVIVNYEGVAGFIPTSQLDPNKVYRTDSDLPSTNKEDVQREVSRKLANLIGNKLLAKVVEIDKQKGRVIFSERLALSDQSAEMRFETMKNIRIGDQMEGTVTAVTPYGIFVNANGLDGLIHVSEISWDKVENITEFAKVGEPIRVKLIDISDDGKKVAYSIKQLSDDPWNDVSAEYKVGSKVKGTITEVEDYGVILKIADGVTGLIHRSELSVENIGDPKDSFKPGQRVEAVIMTIAPSERKMGLSMRKLLVKDDGERPKRDSRQKKKVPGSLDIAGALQKAGISAGEVSGEEGESSDE